MFGNFVKHNDSVPRKLEGPDDAITNYFIDLLTTPGGAAWWAENRPLGHFMPSTFRMIDAFTGRGRRKTDPKG